MGKNVVDLSSLSNDEIEALLIDLILEAYSRGGQIAIKAIYQADEIYSNASDEEKSNSATLAKALTNNLNMKKAWDERKVVADKLFKFFNTTDITVKTWSTNKERRLYLYKTSTRNGSYKGDEIAVFYYTGNAQNPPRYLSTYIIESRNKDELIKLLAEIAEQFLFLDLDVEKYM